MSDRQPRERGATGPEGGAGHNGGTKRIPEATVLRLPIYQRILAELVRAGQHTVSSERLAGLARVNAAKVRKDLSLLGSFGTRGSGYDAEFLVAQIDRTLGLDENWSVAIVGIGNLGRALTNSAGFASRGCQITALFDVDPAVVGDEIRGITVRHMDDLTHLSVSECPDIGVITTPGWAAQGVADLLVRAGVTSILNFAPRVLTVPTSVQLRYVDLSIELQVLGFYRARRVIARAGIEGSRGGEGVEGQSQDDGVDIGVPEEERAPLMRSVGFSPGSDLGP